MSEFSRRRTHRQARQIYVRVAIDGGRTALSLSPPNVRRRRRLLHLGRQRRRRRRFGPRLLHLGRQRIRARHRPLERRRAMIYRRHLRAHASVSPLHAARARSKVHLNQFDTDIHQRDRHESVAHERALAIARGVTARLSPEHRNRIARERTRARAPRNTVAPSKLIAPDFTLRRDRRAHVVARDHDRRADALRTVGHDPVGVRGGAESRDVERDADGVRRKVEQGAR